MQIVRTELEWHYQPKGFLEAGVNQNGPEFVITVDEGLAKVVLNQPLDPVPPDLIAPLRARIQDILDARQLLIHEPYELDEHPHILQHRADGKTNQSLIAGSGVLTVRAFPPDIIVTDATGKVVRDTKAERLAG